MLPYSCVSTRFTFFFYLQKSSNFFTWGRVPTNWLNTSCCFQHRRRPSFPKDALLKPTQLKLNLPLGSFMAFTFKTPKKRLTAVSSAQHPHASETTKASFHNMNIWNVLLTTETEKYTFYLWPNSPSHRFTFKDGKGSSEGIHKGGGGASQQTGTPGSVAAGSHVSTAKRNWC